MHQDYKCDIYGMVVYHFSCKCSIESLMIYWLTRCLVGIMVELPLQLQLTVTWYIVLNYQCLHHAVLLVQVRVWMCLSSIIWYTELKVRVNSENVARHLCTTVNDKEWWPHDTCLASHWLQSAGSSIGQGDPLNLCNNTTYTLRYLYVHSTSIIGH